MTTELKQEAQQSKLCLQAVCRYISDVLAGDASSSEKHIARTIMHLLPLEQAVPIQQADAKTDKPAAVRNPFAARCYTMSESHLSGHRLIVGFEKLVDAQDAHEWVTRQGRGDFTHQAPSVPGDSKRLDYLQDRGATIDLIPGVANFYPMRFRVGGLDSSANIDVRAAIDAAMLAAKGASA